MTSLWMTTVSVDTLTLEPLSGMVFKNLCLFACVVVKFKFLLVSAKYGLALDKYKTFPFDP